MKRVLRLLPALVLLIPAGGCRLLRNAEVNKQDSVHSTVLKQSLKWKADSLYAGRHLFSYTDSSGAQFHVEIIPSGAFTFSPQGGFTGSASLVRLHGKTNTNRRLVDSSSENMQRSTAGELKQQYKEKTAATQTVRKERGNNVICWLLVLPGSCLLVLAVARRIGVNKCSSEIHE